MNHITKNFLLILVLLFLAIFILHETLSRQLPPSSIQINPRKHLEEVLTKKPSFLTFPTTIISAFFDISRNGRPNEHYFNWIKQTLKLNAPFIFFTQAKLRNKIEAIFSELQINQKRFTIITIELEELEYYKDIETVKIILSSSNYKEKIAYPDRIECTNPFYSIVIFSKLTLLVKGAQLNPFNSTKFVWLDAGISRFFKDFDPSQSLTGKLLSNNSFYITLEGQAFKDKDFQTKNEQIIMTAKNFFLAGIMGGTYDAILNVSNELKKKWKYLLNKQIVNNEQLGLLLVYFENPNLFSLKEIPNTDYLAEVFKFLV